jgi:ubiquinone/menaquinone biosynthesis C-methylase UbiE
MKLYNELAQWWPLVSSADDYQEEADFFRQALIDNCSPPPSTLLELGSGGGNNASHLKSHFQLTLVDPSTRMLDVSRTLNPECEHVEGDMRTARIVRSFDAVFIHDAIMYMTTREDLLLAIETAFAHCRPGGVAMFVPDYVRETFEPTTRHGGHDGEGRGVRYLEWTFDPDPTDTTYQAFFSFILRDEDGVMHFENDQHLEGLFGRQEWKQLLVKAGFQPKILRDQFGREIFIGIRPQ